MIEEIETIIYGGKEYHREENGIWRDKDNVKVYEGLQKTLNKVWALQADFDVDNADFEDLWEYGSQFKASGDYSKAIECFEKAITFDRVEIRWILAPLTSCYRSVSMPEKAVALYLKNKSKKYLNSPPFLMSVAAAYLDMNEFEKAKECADRAYALSDGKPDSELRSPYARINKYL